MARLVIDPEAEDRASTRELRDESVAEETLRFDDAGRSQDLDDDVAEAYAEAYDALQTEDHTDLSELDDVGELLAGTVEDVAAALERGEYDDLLDDVERREEEGDARKTVFEAVAQRRRAIQDGDSEEPRALGPDTPEDADVDANADAASDSDL